MGLKNAWQQRNTREKRILLGAAVVLCALGYWLFYVEPLQKKTQRLEQQSAALSAQLPEINAMVEALQGGSCL